MNKWYKFLAEATEHPDFVINYDLSFRQLESIFKVFHLSSEILGDSQNTSQFQFTPRVAKTPMDGEDDFTNRISLAPNINRAIFALDGVTIKNQNSARIRRKYYLYAGDLKSDPSDDIDTMKLNVEMRRCNKDLSYLDSRGNRRLYSAWGNKGYRNGAYPWNFSGYRHSLKKKLFGTYDCNDRDELTGDEEAKCLDIEKIENPKQFDTIGLPQEKQKFYACIPDALETKEEWAMSPIFLYFIGRVDFDEKRVILNKKSLDFIKSKLRNNRIKEKFY